MAWEEGSGADSDVLAVGVSPAGVVDAAPLAIAAGPGDQITPSVAFDGAQFLVGFEDDRVDELQLVRVSPARVALDTPPARLTGAGGWQEPIVLANAAGARLLVWHDYRTKDGDAMAARLSATAALDDPTGFPVVVAAQRHTFPTVAAVAGGDTVFAAWQSTGGGAHTIEALLDDGQATRPVTLPTSVRARGRPSAASGGGQTLLVYEEEDDVVAVRLSDTGQPLDATPVNLSGSDCAYLPHATWGGTGWLVVWKDCRGSSDDIYAARVSTAGAATPPGGFVVASGASTATSPASPACPAALASSSSATPPTTASAPRW